jgi:hypothetical protein
MPEIINTPSVNPVDTLTECLQQSLNSYLKLLETFAAPKAYRELGRTIRCLVVTIGEAENRYDEVSEDMDDLDNVGMIDYESDDDK